MRDFRVARPVTALTLGMGVAPTTTGLKALASGLLPMLAYLGSASKRTVALTALAVAANEHWGAAAGTEVTSCGRLHRQSGPTGVGLDRTARFVKYLHRQRRPAGLGARHRLELGRCGRCRACSSFLGKTSFTASCGPCLIRRPSSCGRHTFATSMSSTAHKGVFAVALRAPFNTPLWQIAPT